MLPRMAAILLPLILLTASAAAQLPAPGEPLPKRLWERSEITLVSGTGLPEPENEPAPSSQSPSSQSPQRISVVASNAGVITVHAAKSEPSLPPVSEAWPASSVPRSSTLKEPVSAPPASAVPLEVITAKSTAPALELLEIPREPPLVGAFDPSQQSIQNPQWQNLSFEAEQSPNSMPPIDPGMLDPTAWEQANSFGTSRMSSFPVEQAWSTETTWNNEIPEGQFSYEGSNCTQCGCDPFGSEPSYYHAMPQADWCPQPDSCGEFLAFGNLGPKFGNERVISNGEVFVPVWQSCDSLVFADIKGSVDDHHSGDVYFGIGYRTFLDPYWIFGSYIYADVIATNQQNVFAQAQVGLELLSLNWDFRINGYGPGSGGASAQTMSGISNGTVVTRSFRERAYRGFDFEIGRRLLHWGWNDRYEFRGFVGGYNFDDSSTGFPSISGPRGRLEMRVYDLGWFGQQSRLEFGVEASYDSERDDQYYGYFRLRIPFGRKHGRPVLDPLRRRMVDTPIHDVD